MDKLKNCPFCGNDLEFAKMSMNSLYGQGAKKTNIYYKAGYNLIGAFTISEAQSNYENFIYADTDSIHYSCDNDSVGG